MNGANSRKHVPPRQSDDLQTAGYAPYERRSDEHAHSAGQMESHIQLAPPDGRMVFEGYRKDIINNFEGDKPRHNPVCILSFSSSSRE